MNDEILTFEEIKTRYPSEWLLIVDVTKDEHLNIKSGRVICHSPDRDVVYNKAVELSPLSCAFHYTGKRPKGTAIVL